MSNLVNQPTALPTRKVFVGAAVAVVTGIVQALFVDLSTLLPQFGTYAEILEPFVPVAIGYCASYLVHDKANT